MSTTDTSAAGYIDTTLAAADLLATVDETLKPEGTKLWLVCTQEVRR